MSVNPIEQTPQATSMFTNPAFWSALVLVVVAYILLEKLVTGRWPWQNLKDL